MPEETFDIQELVKASGVPRRTIYFYVQQGLLPSPEGAGLAAYYTRDHLVRLQLIPLLRQQGLRLDDIRQRFGKMTQDEMEKLIAAQPPASSPAEDALHGSGPAGGLPAPQPGRPVALPMSTPGHPLREVGALSERRFVHYQLPAGITLVAPADMAQAEQMRLRQLLQAAAQIFATPFYSTDENA